jgi:ADP-ribose pyrophosphatase YjhB (NUDIX family)
VEIVKHTMSVGAIVVRGDSLLLANETGKWDLPTGKVQLDESLTQTVIRETKEATGLDIAVRRLAFVTEYRKTDWTEHPIQTYFTADVIGGELCTHTPDGLISISKFVPLRQIRQYMTFRPRLIPLENWLTDYMPRHHYFDLDVEASDVKRLISSSHAFAPM